MSVMDLIVAAVKANNPDRHFDVVMHGNRIICHMHDTIGCRDYQLKGKYHYEAVNELNARTGGHAGFGYSAELGPVAFIGAINPASVQGDGYFKYKVHAFGQSLNEDELQIKQYTKEEAKDIDGYTVFGLEGLNKLNGIVPFEKINYFHDWRFQSRRKADLAGAESNVLSMSIKLRGEYSYNAAKMIAFGSTVEPEGYGGDNVPIQFAIVDEAIPVGIMNLWLRRQDVLFKDVWGPEDSEPIPRPLRFLSESAAKKIKNYKLYYYLPTHSFGERVIEIEKKDRSMYDGFDFVMPDGTDYRLQHC